MLAQALVIVFALIAALGLLSMANDSFLQNVKTDNCMPILGTNGQRFLCYQDACALKEGVQFPHHGIRLPDYKHYSCERVWDYVTHCVQVPAPICPR